MCELKRRIIDEKNGLNYTLVGDYLADELYICLQAVQDRATKKLEALILELLLSNPAPDKTQDSLAWVQHMNSLKAQAEEIVLNEIVYSM